MPEINVHVPKPGPVALCQLYAGPDDAGVPVVALPPLAIETVCPLQMSELVIEPALWLVE